MTPFLSDEQLSAILGAHDVVYGVYDRREEYDDVAVLTEEWIANAVPASWHNQDCDELLRDLESVGLA